MKNKAADAVEILDAIGHENEKEGIRWTKYFMNQYAKKEWEKDQIKKEKLKKANKNKKDYVLLLAKMLQQELYILDTPKDYTLDVKITPKGIIMGIKSPYKNRWVYKAFKPSGIPKYDYAYIQNAVAETDAFMINDNRRSQTDSGIFLP